MKKLILLFTCLTLFNFLKAQKQLVISGYVEDDSTSRRISEVFIYDEAREILVRSNDNGEFSFTVEANKKKPKQVKIFFYHKGFEEVLIDTTPLNDVQLKVALSRRKLKDDNDTLPKYSNLNNKTLLNGDDITKNALSYLESDLNKTLQYESGVKYGYSAKAYDAGVYVRGGSSTDNLYLLDGATVYHAEHANGNIYRNHVSAFSAQAFESLNFEKDAASAQYSGRGSSVIDIKTKDGNMTAVRGELNLNAMAAKLTLEGPILKNKLSFMVSGRRTYLT